MLKPNSQSGQQDQPDQEARTSSDHQAHREVLGTPAAATSTTEYQSYLILQSSSRTTRTRSFFLQDLNKTEEIETFSERSKKLITDMGNTRSSSFAKPLPRNNAQIVICIGNWYCVLFMCRTPSHSNQKLDKKNYDALSIPGSIIKKNLHRGARHGASERQRMYYKVAESSPTQAWWVQNHFGKMAQG